MLLKSFEPSLSQYERSFGCVFVFFGLSLWSKSIPQMHLDIETRIEIALIYILRILDFKILQSLSTPLRGACPLLYIALVLPAKRWVLLCSYIQVLCRVCCFYGCVKCIIIK